MKLISVLIAALAAGPTLAPAAPAPTTFYVSAIGNDAWTGRPAVPNKAGTDGPFATLARARDAIRQMKAAGPLAAPVQVLVRGGVYPITGPFTLTPQDSGTDASPITYAAYPGEKPVLSGGRALRGWKSAGGGVWRTEVPEARNHGWVFRQLFIGGGRATLARSPNEGYFHMLSKAGPAKDPATGKEIDRSKTAFRFREGDLKAWPTLSDVDVKVYHIWETALLPIKSVDEAAGTVEFAGESKWNFGWCGKQRFVVENHPGALDAPGEWQLDRQTGVLSVIPLPGEDLARATVIAPVATQLLVLKGDPDAGQYVEHLRFSGLSFQHAEWALPPEGHGDWQAAVTVGAAVEADGARDCALEGCEVARIGNYAIWFRRGCTENRVAGCHLHNLGAGGVRIGQDGTHYGAEATGRNVVEENFIHDGGYVHDGAHGVWVGQASDNVVAHNEICDFNYTGISVGWSWGYNETTCHRNRVEYNHIHHVGRGVLSDMGGIYTLGLSPGTVVRNNYLHDIWGYQYSGAGGIYPDEGSSGITIENNVVCRTVSGGLTIHYGKNLVVRNNVFAMGQDQQISRGRIDKDTNFTFERNIVLFDEGNLFTGSGKITADNNLYWNAKETPLFPNDVALREWQAAGQDAHSLIADPLFVNPAKEDFALRPGSPALKLGFVPIDISTCGMTKPAELIRLARSIRRPAWNPERKKVEPLFVNDDFEKSPAGTSAEDAVTYGETGVATIRIAEDAAAKGKHSLKFLDAPGLDQPWNPHIWYTPNLIEDVVRLSYDLRLEKGAVVWNEWRDNASPYRVGPSLGTNAQNQLVVADKPVMTLPLGKWVHVEATCGLGKSATGTWDLAVTAPGQPPLRLAKLACTPQFKKLQWLGFISNATDTAVFYIDNVKLERVK